MSSLIRARSRCIPLLAADSADAGRMRADKTQLRNDTILIVNYASEAYKPLIILRSCASNPFRISRIRGQKGMQRDPAQTETRDLSPRTAPTTFRQISPF